MDIGIENCPNCFLNASCYMKFDQFYPSVCNISSKNHSWISCMALEPPILLIGDSRMRMLSWVVYDMYISIKMCLVGQNYMQNILNLTEERDGHAECWYCNKKPEQITLFGQINQILIIDEFLNKKTNGFFIGIIHIYCVPQFSGVRG